jgi:hypothetical protein
MKGRDHSENLGGEERLILKSNLKKYDGRSRTALLCLRVKRSGGFCEDGNEPSDCTKYKKILDWRTIMLWTKNLLHGVKGEWLVSRSDRFVLKTSTWNPLNKNVNRPQDSMDLTETSIFT